MSDEEEKQLGLAYSAIEEYNLVYSLGGEMEYPHEADEIIRKFENMEVV